MSNVTTYMTIIPHRFLYYDLLSSNLINCRNIVFFFFDFTSFNIIICLMTIYTIHSYFLCVYLSFLINIVLLLCGIDRLLVVSTSKILSSQTKVVSLCYYKVSLFMHVVTTRKFSCNPNMKTIIKKLSIVPCRKLLANFNILS
jgi:hypothetical protein